MELMEVMLWDGLVLLGNQSIYFTFNALLLFYFSSFRILPYTCCEVTFNDMLLKCSKTHQH